MKLKVLAVDDESMNLDIIGEYFEEANFDAVFASDGIEALRALHANQDIDVIVLDRMMPNMDGMEFLKHMQEESKFIDIPVIMQTAASASHQIAEGIRAGVFYYLSKPYTKEVFVTLIKAANEDAIAKKQLRVQIREFSQAMSMIQSGIFEFRTLLEAKALAILVGSGFPNREAISMGLTELTINAVEHGNLDITYKEKAELRMSGEWEAEIARRLTLPKYSDKVALLELIRSKGRTKITITDQGAGFDYTKFITYDPSRLSDPNGRGIMLSMNSGLGDITYIDNGNKVECVISS